MYGFAPRTPSASDKLMSSAASSDEVSPMAINVINVHCHINYASSSSHVQVICRACSSH